MGTALTVLGNLALLFAIFFSASMALAWGELGSYDVHGDKSGLAGLLGALAFMAARWSGLAVALAIAVLRGGLPWLPAYTNAAPPPMLCPTSTKRSSPRESTVAAMSVAMPAMV